MRTLWSIPYSPWSVKARWALDHHRIAYRERPYRVGLDEPRLRFRLTRLRGSVSVPVLFEGAAPIEGSWAIAEYAERIGRGAPLLADEGRCRYWNTLSDEACAVGRNRSVRAMIESEGAQREALDGVIPKALQTPMLGGVRHTLRGLLKKYPAPEERRFEEILGMLREAIADSPFLAGEALSYADLSMAAVVDFLAPLPHRGRGPATAKAWRSDGSAQRFADLVAWRDDVVARAGHAPGA